MEQVPQSKLGLMMGIGNLITGIAPAIGPTFGGIVASRLSWRWVFYLLIPLLMISFILGQWGIIQTSVIRRQRIDPLSMLWIVALFVGLVNGFSNLSSFAFWTWQVAGSLGLGLFGMVALTWRSLTIKQPVLKLALFANHAFSGHVLGFFLTQIISLGFAFLLPNYIQLVNGNDSMQAGLLVLPAGFAGAIFAPLGGRILDRFGARRPILLGMSLCLVSLMIFAMMSRQMNNFWISFIYIFYMAGMGMCMGSVMTSALQILGSQDSAQGNAILNTLQQFAGAMGTSLTAAIVAASQKHLSGSLALTTALGTQHAFILLVILAVVILASYYRYVR